jgi:hypothetical protein
VRALVWIVTATLLLGFAVASAASLGGIGGSSLGADDAPVSACDSNGFTVGYTTSGGNVTSVTVSGIADPGCEGGSLQLRLKDSTGASIGAGGPQTVPTDGDTTDNSMNVSASPTPDAALVTGISITVSGP